MNPQDRNNKSILYVIILILLIFNLGLFYLWQTGKTQNNKLANSNKSLEASVSDKNKAIAAAEALLEQYKSDSMTMAKNNQQISSELAKSSGEIARLTFLLKKNDKNSQGIIAELNVQIKQLGEKLARLENENAELKTRNTELKSINMDLNSENNSLSAEKQKLKTLAARLTSSEIRVETLKKQFITRKETNTNRAKGVEALRISFSLVENKIAQKGEREIFIKITGPEGTTLMNEGQGGIADLMDGKSVKYSYKTTVVFENEAKQIPATIWKPTKKLTTGKYTIELYTEGYLMGSSAIDLK
jgi:hypothetical protein